MALQSTTALATITLQSATAEVTFSGIPSTYRDLRIIAWTSASSATNGVTNLRFNGDNTSGNYSGVRAGGNGSSTFSNTDSYILFGSNVEAAFGTVDIMDYSSTDKQKTFLSRWGLSADTTNMTAARWASNSPITSIQLVRSAGLYAIGSTFSLYGVIA
jgi:hypothetical protein